MKRLYLVITVLILMFSVGCQSDIPADSSNPTDITDNSSENDISEYPDHSEPDAYIGVRSIAQLDEMRSILQCTEEELNQYLTSVEGGGARSKDDLIRFLDLIDSLPALELIDGDIVWIAHYYNEDRLTGNKSDGTVYISTMAADGDWTRIEYMPGVKDVSAEAEKFKTEGTVISDVIQSNDGKIKVFSETKERHISDKGDIVKWMLSIDDTFARVVYYTADSSNISAASVFSDIKVSEMSALIKNKPGTGNLPIKFSSDNSTDRADVSIEWLDRGLAASLDEDRGYAMCLVTVVDIDLSNLSDTKGTRVPLKLRIDDVISANDSFGLKEGEVFLTAEYSFWFKSGEAYSVNYSGGIVPITECGAQYIVTLGEYGSFDDIDFDIKYITSSYTVPIAASRGTANDIAELYAAMQLPEDIRKTSANLIKREFGDKSIPDFDEIEAALEKIVKEGGERKTDCFYLDWIC